MVLETRGPRHWYSDTLWGPQTHSTSVGVGEECFNLQIKL